MAWRALASLSLVFGLVAIPVRLYPATERAAAPRFKLVGRSGARLRQRYVVAAAPEHAGAAASVQVPAPSRRARSEPSPASAAGGGPRAAEPSAPRATANEAVEVGAVVGRDQMARGYEYEKGRFVLFSDDELAALRTPPNPNIEIVAFVPAQAVDPIHHDKAYLLAPGPRAERSYTLLWRALQHSDRSALATWAWKGRERVAQIRAATGGLVLQQLFHADEVRSFDALHIDAVEVGETEMRLALQLIERHARDRFDPAEFADAARQRILDAVQRKIAGRETVSHAPPAAQPAGADVVDLLRALRDSLQGSGRAAAAPARKPVARARAGGGARPAKAVKPAR
jgi:DNA end-binding protein Ku